MRRLPCSLSAGPNRVHAHQPQTWLASVEGKDRDRLRHGVEMSPVLGDQGPRSEGDVASATRSDHRCMPDQACIGPRMRRSSEYPSAGSRSHRCPCDCSHTRWDRRPESRSELRCTGRTRSAARRRCDSGRSSSDRARDRPRSRSTRFRRNRENSDRTRRSRSVPSADRSLPSHCRRSTVCTTAKHNRNGDHRRERMCDRTP